MKNILVKIHTKTYNVDIEQLYNDLVNALSITFRGCSKTGLVVAALEDIYKAYKEENYERIIQWAVQEGFDLDDYNIKE